MKQSKQRQNKIPFTTHSIIYDPTQVDQFITDSVNDGNLYGTNKGIYYYNVAGAFDIETSSFYKHGNVQYNYDDLKHAMKHQQGQIFEKVAIMYVWQLGINGRVMIGRTWGEFVDIITEISTKLELSDKKRLILYVHNLGYEFQFIRTLFKWQNVFSIDERKPIYAITEQNVEFRCSYLLTGYSLANLGKNLTKYPVHKLDGDLDYTKIRHADTPLTTQELNYCINDVRVVMSAITERIEQDGSITRIPLTKTGYVRRYSRNNTLYTRHPQTKRRNHNYKYNELINELQINDLDEFDVLQRAFQGGFTHANSAHANKTIEDVASLDFDSSYPYVMISEKYPMSRGLLVQPKTAEEFNYYNENYCTVFDVQFTNIIASITAETPISVSKCFDSYNVVENNGRVFSADQLTTTLTNVDYKVIRVFYTWEKIRINSMYIYKCEYLPTEFVNVILDLYKDKTELKGVESRAVDYALSKEMLNSTYGMIVTNPLRDEYLYETFWHVKEPTTTERKELLYKYNTGRNRFLFYPWGMFVTAYARRNLFTAIWAIQGDYIYSDTDSIKLMNYEKHKKYFDWYNTEVVKKLYKACDFHGIDRARVQPRTMHGNVKTLGIWEFEGILDEFKTLGAKRYMVKEKNALFAGGNSYDYSLTVSGLNKYKAIPYLIAKYGEANIMDAFNDGLYIPPEGTGKNIHSYIDYPIEGEVVDYLGVANTFYENTSVHLESTDYTLSLSTLYLDYILGKHFIK